MTTAPFRLLPILALAVSLTLATAACSAAGKASLPPPATGVAGACPTSQPPPLPAGQTRTVTLATGLGDIVIKVTADLSPIATGNFVALASCGFYDGTVFHRVVPNFVIQGGDPTGTGAGGPGYKIKDEPVTAPYHRGTVAMARTVKPDSADSQFFIVLSDGAAPALSSANTYAIMGEVTAGMDVVDAIAAMPNSGEPDNAALDPLPITKATVARP